MKTLRILILYSLVVLPMRVCGQHNSLQEMQLATPDNLSEDQEFEAKRDIFVRLVKERYHPDTIIAYSEQFYEQCIQMEKYDDAAEVAGILSNKYNTHSNNPSKSVAIMQDVRQYYNYFEDPYSRGTIFSKIGGVYFSQGRMDSAIVYYQMAIPHFSIQNKLSEADMHFFSGQGYADMDSLAQGAKSFTKAYHIYHQKGDSVYMAESLSEQASLFAKNELYGKAELLLSKSDSISSDLHLHDIMATNDLNRAQMHRFSEDYKSEKIALADAQEHIEDGKSPYFYKKYRLWCSLVKNHVNLNQMGVAKVKLDSLDNHDDFHIDNPTTKVHYLLAKLHYLNHQELPKRRSQVVAELESQIKDNNHKELLSDSYEILIDYYSSINDQDKVIELTEDLLKLQKNKTKNTLANQLAYFQIEFDVATKNYEIENQKLRIENFDRSQQSLKRQWFLGFMLLSSLFALIYFVRSKKVAKKGTKLQERFANQLIEQQEYEKKSVSQALHDGIGQSLLLIKNKIHLNQDDPTITLLEDTIVELSEISRSLHPVQVKQLGLTKAIIKNIEQVDKASDTYFSMEIESIDGIFDEKQTLHIYRIVQEVITNVIKHAKAHACKVTIKHADTHVKIDIKDNGLGFDFTEEYDKIGSLGLKTIKSRVSDLRAQFTFDSSPGKGMHIEIIIPKPAVS